MDELKMFEKENFKIRVVEQNGDIWFVAKDIADTLGYSDTATMTRRLDEDEKGMQNLQTLGGLQGMAIINESGLYNAIIGSKKEEAKIFKKWVTSEVLPSIRKHGGYITPQKVEEMINNPDTMIVMLNALKKERQEKEELLNKNKNLIQKIETDKPRVDFAIGIETSATSISVREYAKIISKDGFVIGEKRLFNWLRDNNFIMWNNEPYQKYIVQNIFEVKEGFYIAGDSTKPYKKTLITGKGQIYFGKKLIEKRDSTAQIAQ